MRFSFVTCTYNRVDTLRRTLQALINQSFDPKNYQIIVVDNNSDDGTEDMCNKLIQQTSSRNIEYYKEINQGLSFALNRGIKEARGEYIVYVDDDETVGTEHLSRLEAYLTNYSYIEMAASAVIPIYEVAEPLWMSPFTQRLIGGYFNEGTTVKRLKGKKYPGTGHTIIKRVLYDKYGGYNTELGRKGAGLMGAEDKDMAFRLIENNVECYYLPNIPVFHHIPQYKLSKEFFSKLTYAIGQSERVRTLGISKKAYNRRLFDEVIKWIASFVLCFFYFVTLCPPKGLKLLSFRWNVSKGLLEK